MSSVLFLVHPDRPAAKELAGVARAFWEAHGYEVADAGEAEPASGKGEHEFAISFGGDGTMLRTLQLARPDRIPVLGINLGHMGYLAEVEPLGMQRAFDRLLAGDYRVEERVALEVAVHRADGTGRVLHSSAINEAIVERNAPGHTIRVAVDIAGVRFLTYVADGLLVCTPTGSTAYNLSARGPVLSPNMRSLVLTAVAPHLIFDRSLVLGLDEPVTLTLMEGRPATLVLDGSHSEPIAEGDAVVCSAAEVDARFVTFGDVDFHAVLRSRFSLADG
ncbi:MAG TPA: NAD(+)/NADH kinase [Acidimicrobiales bacterium]|nr:NAD(+)/NADH kinase [Acidimicrobiales bacterium]